MKVNMDQNPTAEKHNPNRWIYYDVKYTHETLVCFEVISFSCNALVVPFQQRLETYWKHHVHCLNGHPFKYL